MSENPESKGFAVIDIGSNSVRMVIFDIEKFPLGQLFNEKIFCALGRDLGITGRLNPEGRVVALDTIRTYRATAARYGISDICAVATAAVRDAADGMDFVRMIEDEIDLEIRVISGKEEAIYAAMGVISLDPKVEGVVADFGGGSLELALVESGEITDTVSLPLGAFRVQAMGKNAESQIRDILGPYCTKFGGKKSLCAIGGTWRALALAHSINSGRKDHDIQGYTIPAGDLVSFCQKIEETSIEVLTGTYHLEGHRAEMAGVAAKMLRLLVLELNPAIFTTSQAGVRDGLVHEFLSRKQKGA